MNPSPLMTFWSGLVSSGVPRVRTRINTKTAHSAMTGMARMQNASIPFESPRKIRKKLSEKVMIQKTNSGLMPPENSAPSAPAPVKLAKNDELSAAYCYGSAPRLMEPVK